MLGSSLPDGFWNRHSNPKSGWSRMLLMPLLAAAVYARRPRLLLATVAFAVLNPLLFPEPEEPPTGDFMYRVVRAEEAWTREGRPLFGPGYPEVLNGLNVAATLYTVYAAAKRRPAGTVLATAASMGLKLLFVAEVVRWHDRETRGDDRLRVSESVHVDAPVDEVFAFMDEPENQRRVTPAITDVRNVEALENGGKRLDFTYRLAGVPVDGSLRTPEYTEDERVVFEMSGALSGTITWTFEPDAGGTRVTYAAEYDLPGRALSTAARPVAKRYNERQLRLTLENLRAEFARRTNPEATG
jgi:carbon monoxide dehydrogenase subunit G